jgi:hypothetical protein
VSVGKILACSLKSRIGKVTTVYMQAVLDRLSTEGLPVEEDDLAHLSPARFEHVNPYGKYLLPMEQAAQRHGLRPLRAA